MKTYQEIGDDDIGSSMSTNCHRAVMGHTDYYTMGQALI